MKFKKRGRISKKTGELSYRWGETVQEVGGNSVKRMKNFFMWKKGGSENSTQKAEFIDFCGKI